MKMGEWCRSGHYITLRSPTEHFSFATIWFHNLVVGETSEKKFKVILSVFIFCCSVHRHF